MPHKKISIIIKANSDISAITSLLQQTCEDWECIVVNNLVKNIEQHIINDPRFKIINDIKNNNVVYDAIKKSNGDYILLLNSNDTLYCNAIKTMLDIIYFTDADIIKFNSNLLSQNIQEEPNERLKFKYLFNKGNFIEYMFEDLSEFCFKKDIISNFMHSDHVFLTNLLANAKDMATTSNICIMKQEIKTIDIYDVVENYVRNKNKISDTLWKDYFQRITPQIINSVIKNNNKKLFLDFCRQIPTVLIPLPYRIMCYILKKTNK